MSVEHYTIEDAYRELYRIDGVVSVLAESGTLTVEHKDIRDKIDVVIESTSWEIVDATNAIGQYPSVDVAQMEDDR